MGARARASWLDGPSPTLRAATLTLLVGRSSPIRPYKLGLLLKRQLGPAWQIDPKIIYMMLDGLESEGLVSSESILEDGRPVKQYRATNAANRVVDDWMQSQVSIVPRRVELQAKIALSREQDVPYLERALDEYERDCFQLLHGVQGREIPPVSWRAIAMNISRRVDDLMLRAELSWIEEARAWIADWRNRDAHAHDR